MHAEYELLFCLRSEHIRARIRTTFVPILELGFAAERILMYSRRFRIVQWLEVDWRISNVFGETALRVRDPSLLQTGPVAALSVL